MNPAGVEHLIGLAVAMADPRLPRQDVEQAVRGILEATSDVIARTVGRPQISVADYAAQSGPHWLLADALGIVGGRTCRMELLDRVLRTMWSALMTVIGPPGSSRDDRVG